ncbi:DUF1223 domain-containing protein [Roseateles violae]|uniref:DUF1223 domain-containing protein n=1 Tax=Roseateles violae TaxID=3058042 RepID=A0ABT8DSR9_9BURK|nr:DUF1223 domain-containing protein [Pelomonas sp. PFR6]MDN3919201.1 DUF1223 domain-containing protein [Pelomonas sp. PFR6]
MGLVHRLVLGLLLAGNLAAAQAQSCAAQSGMTPPLVVELYTSEGCDSCPPADRWLSGLRGRPGVFAAAFHVDYWDRLGWRDRFASPLYTARQQQNVAQSGARFAYTPQIVVNGRDWRDGELPTPSASEKAVIALKLQRDGEEQVAVESRALPGAPARVQLWWAQLEDGHSSEVRAGENRGATLRHDAVVRAYASLPAGGADQQWLLKKAPAKGEDGRPRRLLLVATDAANGRVLQAAQLGC